METNDQNREQKIKSKNWFEKYIYDPNIVLKESVIKLKMYLSKFYNDI